MASPTARSPPARRPASRLFALLLVLLPTVVAAAVYSLRQLTVATTWVKHTGEVRIALDLLLENVLEAESAERGFLLTHSATYSEELQQTDAEWTERVAAVRALTADNPSQQAGMATVVRLEDAHRRVRGPLDPGSSLALRQAIDQMRSAEAALSVERQVEQWNRVRALLALLLVSVFLLGVLTIGALTRQRHEAQFEADRQLFYSVLEAIDEGITVQDQTGQQVFANGSAARMVGLSSAQEFLAASPGELARRFDLYTEDGTKFPVDQLPGRAVLSGKPGDEVLVRYHANGQGEERWRSVRAAPLHDREGRVTHAINLFRDVSERRREEQQRTFLLRAMQQFNASLDFQATLATVAKQVVPSLADWCAVDVLESGQLKRLAVEHVDPQKISLVQEIQRRYPADPKAPGSPQEILRSGKPFLIGTIPAELLRAGARDAEHLALIEQLQLRSILSVPLMAGGEGVGVLTLAMAESGRSYSERDILFASTFAERAATAIENAGLFRATAAALSRETTARQEAERATHFSEMFVGMLGHDLRNPLSAIGTSAQFLLQVVTDERQRRPALRIVSSTERMARMIDQLLDFTRIRLGGGLGLTPTALKLDELAQQIVDETETAQECSIQVARAGDLHGIWDGDRLGQVLANLLTNAARHGVAGQKIQLRLEGESPDAVVLEVRNPGLIPSEIMPTLFEPFRSGTTRPRGAAVSGLGLGLYITKAIVEAHHGTIDLTSTEADGTMFRIQLPRREPAGARPT